MLTTTNWDLVNKNFSRREPLGLNFLPRPCFEVVGNLSSGIVDGKKLYNMIWVGAGAETVTHVQSLTQAYSVTFMPIDQLER